MGVTISMCFCLKLAIKNKKGEQNKTSSVTLANEDFKIFL